jgi:Glycosyl transferase family 2
MRNEAARLPHFLAHHRRLGVGHFLIVDNDSSDGTGEMLADQPDVSLWRTARSYKAARFGVDWLTWLQMRHAHGHWCLTADADELLVYPYCETRDLRALTGWLQEQGRSTLAAMMLDLYPQGPLSPASDGAAQDPVEALGWFDAGNYTMTENPVLWNLWLQGGPRARAFFAADPRRAPTLSKTPLVHWDRRYVYVNSTHSLLPRGLNRVYDRTGGEAPSGVLLHTKFLPGIVERAREERVRGEHFHDGNKYQDYYAQVIAAPDLWHRHARRYTGWRQLEALGLMSRGGWV